MALPRPSSPKVVWHDFKNFLDQGNRYKLLFGALSLMIPALLVAGFYVDSRVDPPGPQLIYVQNWPADRSDAEIIAQQKIDQAAREKAMAKRQAEWKRLGDRFGM